MRLLVTAGVTGAFVAGTLKIIIGYLCRKAIRHGAISHLDRCNIIEMHDIYRNR